MNYFLTEEQEMIKELAAKIADEKIAPIAIEYDHEGKFPHDIVKYLAQSDLCGVYIEEKYGGLGGGVFEMALVVEELSRACGGIALAFAGTGLGTYPIILFGNEEQKQNIFRILQRANILPHLHSPNTTQEVMLQGSQPLHWMGMSMF